MVIEAVGRRVEVRWSVVERWSSDPIAGAEWIADSLRVWGLTRNNLALVETAEGYRLACGKAILGFFPARERAFETRPLAAELPPQGVRFDSQSSAVGLSSNFGLFAGFTIDSTERIALPIQCTHRERARDLLVSALLANRHPLELRARESQGIQILELGFQAGIGWPDPFRVVPVGNPYELYGIFRLVEILTGCRGVYHWHYDRWPSQGRARSRYDREGTF